MYISKTSELEKFCTSLDFEDYIAIDTEFSRQSTYYPKLCIIQIASSKNQVIIDTLSTHLDLAPLGKILLNEKITKVFHSAKQDLEILYNYFNFLPKNIFDTQIAASFCGFGLSISYEKLVLKTLNIQIDKSYRVSDWSQRPLLAKQVEYALGDVIHLRRIYQYLIKLLADNDQRNWLNEDLLQLNSPENFVQDVNLAWQKIKSLTSNKINLVAKRLATWREIKAQEFNLPRNHYLKEKKLVQLIEKMPISLSEIKLIEYFKDFDENLAKEIIQIISHAINDQLEYDLQSNDLLRNDNRVDLHVLHSLKTLLQLKSKKYSIPSGLIANTQELKQFLAGDLSKNKIRFLKGWRYKIYGYLALNLKSNS